MITRTSLTNINLQARVYVAMRQAIKQSNKWGVGLVVLKSGISVRHGRRTGWKGGFSFFDKNKVDITKQMIQALRA